MFLSHIMLGFVFYFSALLADMSGFAGFCLTPSLLFWFFCCVSSVSVTGSYAEKEPSFFLLTQPVR